MSNQEVIKQLAERIIAIQRPHPVRVAIDGIDAAGKKRYLQRYYPGQQLYLQAVHPEERADAIIENNDFHQPGLFFPHRI